MKLATILLAIALAGLPFSVGCDARSGVAAREGPERTVLRVAAASDLKFALDEAIAEFHKSQPKLEVSATYGSSGNFYAQLSNKAPFDLFLAADVDYPDRLIAAGLADDASEFLYGIGQIVVWAPRSSGLDVESLGIQALTDPRVNKIAIANPSHAPYGRAAEAALKSLGVYEEVRARLVLGENIAQTAQFVETGAADVGIIALSLALAPTLKEKGVYWSVPLDAYPRMEQAGVILNGASDRTAAQAFKTFLLAPTGQQILARYGFKVPGD